MHVGISVSMTTNTPPGITDGKIRENRLRRAADRQGLRLHKSNRRDPNALGYGLWALIDLDTGASMHNPAPWGIHVLDQETTLRNTCWETTAMSDS
jgi:hypothetical protein